MVVVVAVALVKVTVLPVVELEVTVVLLVVMDTEVPVMLESVTVDVTVVAVDDVDTVEAVVLEVVAVVVLVEVELDVLVLDSVVVVRVVTDVQRATPMVTGQSSLMKPLSLPYRLTKLVHDTAAAVPSHANISWPVNGKQVSIKSLQQSPFWTQSRSQAHSPPKNPTTSRSRSAHPSAQRGGGVVEIATVVGPDPSSVQTAS